MVSRGGRDEEEGEEEALPLPRRRADIRLTGKKEEEEEEEEGGEEEDECLLCSSSSVGDEDSEEEEEEEGGREGGIMGCPPPSLWQLLLPFVKRHLLAISLPPLPFLVLVVLFLLHSVLL